MKCPYIIVDRMKNGKLINHIHIQPSKYRHQYGKTDVTWENPRPCDGMVKVGMWVYYDGKCASEYSACSMEAVVELEFTCSTWKRQRTSKYGPLEDGLAGITSKSIEEMVQEWLDGQA